MITKCRHIVIGSSVLLLAASTVWAESPSAPNDQIDVGIFTAVEGKVGVTHPGLLKPIPAKLQEGVLFKDVIETDKESRTKALLNDDSILTVGEHSRVQITEHIYDPNKGVRSVVVSLVKGKVRALVGRVFSGSGSKFEIHTPTAVAAARGTYFVVWHVNGSSGIANIGSHGEVGFSSGGQTVTVAPGSFSISPPGGGPPVPPAPLTGGNTPAQVTAAVQGTTVADSPESENPSRAAAASGGTAPVQSPPANANVPAGTSGVSSPSASFGTTTTTSPTSTIVSIPAVISGAAGSTTTTTSSGGSTGGGGSTPPPVVEPPPVVIPPPSESVVCGQGLCLGRNNQQPGQTNNPPPGQSGILPAPNPNSVVNTVTTVSTTTTPTTVTTVTEPVVTTTTTVTTPVTTTTTPTTTTVVTAPTTTTTTTVPTTTTVTTPTTTVDTGKLTGLANAQQQASQQGQQGISNALSKGAPPTPPAVGKK